MKAICAHPLCEKLATMALFTCQNHWHGMPAKFRQRLNCLADSFLMKEISAMEIERDHFLIAESLWGKNTAPLQVPQKEI